MTVATRAEDATKRVMDVIRRYNKDRSEVAFKIIEDEWYDYFFDLLNDELTEEDLIK